MDPVAETQWQPHPAHAAACLSLVTQFGAVQEGLLAAKGKGWHWEGWGPLTQRLGLIGSSPGLSWKISGSGLPQTYRQPGPAELAEDHGSVCLLVSLGPGSGP